MKRWLCPLLGVAMVALLASCLEESTVIKVSKDGSGVVQVRHFFRTLTTEEQVELPAEAELAAKAARMGEGVRLEAVRKSHNARGWFGHEEIYRFSDINQLVIRMKDDPDSKEKSEPADRPEMHFQLKDGVLEARVDNPAWSELAKVSPKTETGPTLDPYVDAPGPPAKAVRLRPAGMKIGGDAWKEVTDGMRIGVFLQFDDPLVEAASRYRKGGLHTLVNVDFERVSRNPDIESLQQLHAGTREEMREVVRQVDGFEIDLQQPIRFVFE
ncbi:hypothetical protein [Haloferula sargassicola]|uniref:Lipoprotein n=1 Tax=Haloferula sargassicola TaxID=490096 RepID=A0ABP9UL08_9BACT